MGSVDAEERRAIKASELLYENRQMRRLGEHARALAIAAKRKTGCAAAAEALAVIIELIEQAHDIDFSDPKVAREYRLPGASHG